jgi:hypothetical protein
MDKFHEELNRLCLTREAQYRANVPFSDYDLLAREHGVAVRSDRDTTKQNLETAWSDLGMVKMGFRKLSWRLNCLSVIVRDQMETVMHETEWRINKPLF